ncbi:MAG: PilZ domain-containing protein [Pseudorhodoplanes sp.]
MHGNEYVFRKYVRRPIKLPGILSNESGAYIVKTQTVDLSEGGAKLKIDRAVVLPSYFWLSLSDKGDVRRICELVWRTASTVGVRFINARQLKLHKMYNAPHEKVS